MSCTPQFRQRYRGTCSMFLNTLHLFGCPIFRELFHFFLRVEVSRSSR